MKANDFDMYRNKICLTNPEQSNQLAKLLLAFFQSSGRLWLFKKSFDFPQSALLLSIQNCEQFFKCPGVKL
jgi:hypothetical protein